MEKIIISILFLLIIDFIWISLNKSNYNDLVSGIQGQDIKLNPVGGIIAYSAMIIAFVYFVVPLLQKGNYLSAINGGLLGLCIYAVFNGTNLAMFNNYTYKMAFIDTMWGTVLYTLTSLLYLYIQ